MQHVDAGNLDRQARYSLLYFNAFWAALREDTRVTIVHRADDALIIEGDPALAQAAIEAAHLSAAEAARSQQTPSNPRASTEQTPSKNSVFSNPARETIL